MNNNLGAAILSYSKGIKLKLISATIIGDISLLSDQNLIKLKNEFGQVEAIKKFAAANDRKLILVTNSKGSLSDLIARYWLSKNFPNYKSYIDIIHAGDIAQLQQIFILNKADLISSFIPIKESISLKRSNIDYFLSTKELMKNQPGGALAMRAEFLDSHKVEAHKLKILYQKATDLMLSDPDRAAKHIEKHLLGGLLTKEIIKEILIQNKEFFNTDLNLVKDNTQLIHDFMLEEKYINQPINLDNIFN
jgi:NitT/TauT family transport system substrate-binding protein